MLNAVIEIARDAGQVVNRNYEAARAVEVVTKEDGSPLTIADRESNALIVERLARRGAAVLGITDHAQELLGDLVFVELPEVGADRGIGAECAVVESVKAASDVYSPLYGQVIEVNEALADAPETP